MNLVQMAVDRAGNVFVNGVSIGDGYMVTIKYSSSIPLPRLDFQKLDNALVLSWTNAGFNLQTAPAVTGPFTKHPRRDESVHEPHHQRATILPAQKRLKEPGHRNDG